jgi:hypothetical protein
VRKFPLIGICIIIALLAAGFSSANDPISDAIMAGLADTPEQKAQEEQLLGVLMEGISGTGSESSAKLIALNTMNVKKAKSRYDIELSPETGPVKSISMKGVSEAGQENNLRLAEVGNSPGFVQAYAIDPTEVNFTNATVTAVAKGTELYKCKDWDFPSQACYGEWVKLMDITPGEEYTFLLTPEDPGFAEVVSSCSAEDNEPAKGSFAGACDDITGARLEHDDLAYENHTYQKNEYAGVRINSINTTITDCGSINSVKICYKWWRTSTATPVDCDVSVDADGGASYTAVTTACPGIMEPASANCTDVTSLENWTCENFFGSSGTRAYAKSEISRIGTGAATTETATWDMLYFDVNYTLSAPEITILAPRSKDEVSYNTKSTFVSTQIEGRAIDTCWYSFNGGSNTTFNCYNIFPQPVAQEGLNNLTIYANNTEGKTGNATVEFRVNTSIPLVVAIISPPNGTSSTSASPKIKLIGVDNAYTEINYTLYIYHENGTLYSEGNNGTMSNYTITEITLSPALTLIGNLTKYIIRANASDAGGSAAVSNNITYILTVPVVELASPKNNYWSNVSSVNFTFKVYDPSYSNLSCSLYINGTLNQTNNETITGNLTAFNVSGIAEAVSLPWEVECTNPIGLKGSDSRIFNIDKTIPVINWVNDTPDPVNESIIINITANVTDNFGLDRVIFRINGETHYMAHAGNSIYYYGYSTSGLSGNYSYIIEAYDNAENEAVQAGGNFTVISVGDVAAPTSNSPADQAVELGEETSITWVLQDNVAPGYYYVERDSTLFAGPYQWSNNTPIIIRPDTHFLSAWPYTIYYNDSTGNSGIPDAVIVSVVDNETPSCDESGGNGPVLANITVDGNVDEWGTILSNPLNYVTDLSTGGGDLDATANSERDIVTFAYTWDSQYLYLYYKRLAVGGKNTVSVLAYIDYNNDGYMNATDKVVKFVWSGSNQKYDSDLYNYIPGGTADLMNGSGYNLPGSITTNKSMETGVTGGSQFGLHLETRVLWSDLGLPGPVPLTFQAATALASGTNLPSQLEDNADKISTNYASLLFRPDNSKSAKNGTSVYYIHEMMNCGLSADTYDLTNLSTEGWSLTYYYPNSSLITDTNSNSNPDVQLGTGNYTPIIVKIDVPAATSFGTVDSTYITATSALNLNYSRNVTDTTTVGDITIIPSQRKICGVAGSAAFFNYTVSNYQGVTDTIEASASSSNGWNTTLHYANGTLLGDTDSDNQSDLGSLLSEESAGLLVMLYMPQNATIGTTDTVTITVNSSVSPSTYATSTALVNVKHQQH